MRRLVVVLSAVALLYAGLRGPRWWGPFSGQLHFSGSYAGDATLGSPLPIDPVSQYQGLPTDGENCGPASVAALVRWMRPDLAVGNTADLVARIRADTGVAAGGTSLAELAHALDDFGVSNAPLFASDAPGGSDDSIGALRLALAHGSPVLAAVRAADLYGGSSLENHWIVITGTEPDTGAVDVVDPATPPGFSAGWTVGGNAHFSASVLAQALKDTGDVQGLYALVVDAHRSGPAPALVFLPTGGLLLLFGLFPRRRRV